MSNSFDFEQFKANAMEQLKVGVPLSGKDEYWRLCWKICLTAPLKERWQPSGRQRTRVWQPLQRSHEQAGTDLDGRSSHKHTVRPGRHFRSSGCTQT